MQGSVQNPAIGGESMPWQEADYESAKEAMQLGDVIAFGGMDGVSAWIKAVTQSPVSHLGIVLYSCADAGDESSAASLPQIVEARGELNQYYGVAVREMDDHIESYQGTIWWLPLSDASRAKLDVDKFRTFLLEMNGRPFDIPQAIGAAWDDLDQVPGIGELTRAREELSALFCSELVAAGLEAGGVIRSLNCAEVTPIDVFRFAIYQDTYYQIKGAKEEIEGHNTVDPEGWGE
jgi:hypothetical protein